MFRVINLTNHTLTKDQKDDLRVSVASAFNETEVEVVDLPAALKNVWGNIDPNATVTDLRQSLSGIKDFITDINPSAVVIGGEISATMTIIFSFPQILFLSATTKRESIEIQGDDGTVIKKSIFKHIRFRNISSSLFISLGN